MEKIIVKMLDLGIKVSFDCDVIKLDTFSTRFFWSVSQYYVSYKKSCEWEGFASPEECIENFKINSSEILKTVNELLDKKNKNK